jgi:beta-galactosidase GanA
VESDTALLFTSLNWNIKLTQEINSALPNPLGFVGKFYKHIISSGIHPDVIDAQENLDKYKLIFTPTAYSIDEYGFSDRIKKWVENGGVWVVGPLTDIRTAIGTKYQNSPYGSIEEVTDTRLAYTIPDDAGAISLINDDGDVVHGSAVYEMFELGDYKPLLTVKDAHSALVGKCVSFVKSVGKGYVVMIGTLPEEKELLRIIKKAIDLAKTDVYEVDEGLMVTKRVKGDDVLTIVASVGGKAGKCKLDGEFVDVIYGDTYVNEIRLKPFELRILKKNK